MADRCCVVTPASHVSLPFSICPLLLAFTHFCQAVRNLFGNKYITAVIDLPSHLEHFISALPPGHKYTVDHLIDCHTLLPFYSAFRSPEKVELVRKSMRGNQGNSVHRQLGIATNHCLHTLNWLRFCPLCMEEDRKLWGECYWHRLHQLPGVEVCPTHTVFLENSSVKARNRKHYQQFVSAEAVLQPLPTKSLDPLNLYHKASLKLALDVSWLLAQHGLTSDLEILRKRYLLCLAKLQLATYRGYVYSKQLLKSFRNYYPSDFLNSLRCEVEEESAHNWLLDIVRSPHYGAKHPLRHLLLIQFLGYPAETFFKLSEEFKPFGDAPWPCLNPASKHFRQLQITKCTIKHNKKPGSKPVGVFQCSCGFIYCRTGPDLVDEDRFRVSKVKSYGLLWEKTLKKLWQDETVKLYEIAARLRMSRHSVKQHAVKLGLPCSRIVGRPERLGKQAKSNSVASYVTGTEKLEAYRMEWLVILQENPNVGRTRLRKEYERFYNWLRKNDRQWLEENQPPAQQRGKRLSRTTIDWNTRDAELASAVLFATQDLSASSKRPIRITLQAIGRQLDSLGLLQKQIDKLPLTAKALNEATETAEDWTIRKIKWAVDSFEQERIPLKRWKLLKRVGISSIAAESPKVQKAINKALQLNSITAE